MQRNEEFGIPNFNRYTQHKSNINPIFCQDSVINDNLQQAYKMSVKSPKMAVPFKNLQGRDNLYEKMHGLPKITKEEAKKQKQKYEKYVDFKEFLPNNVLQSPKRNTFSNSYKTKSIGLFNLDDHSNLKQSLNFNS